jgi:hypothetical protein
LTLDDVRVVRQPLVLATPADVDALEARLWVSFPEGYRAYITQVGEGVLGSFIRIYPPWRIEKELAEWRRRINKYWFWDECRVVLPKERALESVVLGDTTIGDELVFHPARRDRLFVLPRDSEQVFAAGSDLLTAVEWMCRSGRLIDEVPPLEFEPFDSRASDAEAEPGEAAASDPEGESLDDLVDLAKRWAERHEARKLADKAVKEELKRLKSQWGRESKSTLVYEALNFKGEFPHEAGYLAVFRIEDKTTRLEIGTFTWHKNEDSSGSQYAPNQANLAKLQQSK